jgi:hypothetical protein
VAAPATTVPAQVTPVQVDSAETIEVHAEESPSRITAFLENSLSRGFYEDEIAYWAVNGKIRYALSSQFEVRLSAGLRHGFTEYTDDRRRFDVEDPVLGLSYSPDRAARDVSDPTLRTLRRRRQDTPWIPSLGLSWIIPVSETSRDASLQSAFVLSGGVSKSFGRLFGSYRLALSGYLHKYDTENAQGTDPNPYAGVQNTLEVGYRLTDRLSTSGSATVLHFLNYEQHLRGNWALDLSLNYQITGMWGAYIALHHQQRVLTNNSVWDRNDSGTAIAGVVLTVR